MREKAEERVIARAGELGALKRARPDACSRSSAAWPSTSRKASPSARPAVDVIAGPDSYRRMPELLDAARAEHAIRSSTSGSTSAETYEGLVGGAIGGDGVRASSRSSAAATSSARSAWCRSRAAASAARRRARCCGRCASSPTRAIARSRCSARPSTRTAYEDVDFAELLRAVAGVDGIERIRFTSPYPVDFTDDVIAAIAEEPKVCKYVHLPVQSGSDAVLERMRRGYTVADFRAIVAALRAAMPGIALVDRHPHRLLAARPRTITAQTLALMREIRFDSAFMFAYSERD